MLQACGRASVASNVSLGKRGALRAISGLSRDDTRKYRCAGMKQRPKQSSFKYQVVALVSLCVQNTALVFCTKISLRKVAVPYVTSVVVVCSEFVKLCLSCALLYVTDGLEPLLRAFREIPSNAVQLGLPAVLYVLQSNLIFKSIGLLSPTLYMVCSQSKIFSSAFFSVTLLKLRLSRKQHCALVLLTCGMVAVQTEESARINSYEMERRPRQSVETVYMIKGLTCVFGASLTSGFTGAYLERMYKRTERTCSVWYRNLQLASFSLPVALTTAILSDRAQIVSRGPFQGYDVIVCIIIFLHAAGGLIVATVMRYAGNIMKCFAISMSICACALLSTLTEPDISSVRAQEIAGIAIVLVSIFMFAL